MARRGRGRPKGSLNKRTLAQKAAADIGDNTPLAHLLHVMRTDESLDRRLQAAVSAAPYCHHRLAAIQDQGDPIKITGEMHISFDDAVPNAES